MARSAEDHADQRRRLEALRAVFRSPEGCLLVGVIGHLIRRDKNLAQRSLDEAEAIARGGGIVRFRVHTPSGELEDSGDLRITGPQADRLREVLEQRLRAFAALDLSRGRPKPRGLREVYSQIVEEIASRIENFRSFLGERSRRANDPLLAPYRSDDQESEAFVCDQWAALRKHGPAGVRPERESPPPGLVHTVMKAKSPTAAAREIVRLAAGRAHQDPEDFRRRLRRSRDIKS